MCLPNNIHSRIPPEGLRKIKARYTVFIEGNEGTNLMTNTDVLTDAKQALNAARSNMPPLAAKAIISAIKGQSESQLMQEVSNMLSGQGISAETLLDAIASQLDESKEVMR